MSHDDKQDGQASAPMGESHRLKEIPDHIKEFIQAKVDYIKLTAIEAVGNTAANAVSGAAMLFLGLFCMVFLSIALGLFLGDELDSMAKGFLIVGGIYFLLILLILLLKQRLIHTPIINALITKLANPSRHETTNK